MPRIGSGGADLDAIDADRVLLLAVAVEGTQGEAWDRLAARVMPVGRNTLLQWLYDGSLLPRLRNRGLGTPGALANLVTRRSGEEFEDLALDTAIAALDYWRRVVIPAGRWRPESQLSTYFVGACLLRVGRVAQQRPHVDRPLDDELLLAIHDRQESSLVHGPPHQVQARDELAQVLGRLGTLPPEDRDLVVRAARGVSAAVLAEGLGISRRAVEGRLYRARRKLRDAAA